jgi:hypothetical protein
MEACLERALLEQFEGLAAEIVFGMVRPARPKQVRNTDNGVTS